MASRPVASSDPTTRVVIPIYGVLGQGDLTGQKLCARLPQEATEIVLHVASVGGSMYDALAFFYALARHNAHKTSTADGLVASAATIPFLAGDRRVAYAGSVFFVHDPKLDADEDEDKAKEAFLDISAEAIAKLYASRTRLSASEARRLMQAETSLDAKDALRLGFVTEISAADVEMRLSPYPVLARHFGPKVAAGIDACSRSAQVVAAIRKGKVR